MLIEPLVFHRDERLSHVCRQRLDADQRAPFTADLADQGAVAGKHHGRLRRRDDAPGLARRTLHLLTGKGRRKGEANENPEDGAAA